MADAQSGQRKTRLGSLAAGLQTRQLPSASFGDMQTPIRHPAQSTKVRPNSPQNEHHYTM